MKKWTKEEEQKLIELYPIKTAQEIANILHRTVASIEGKSNILRKQNVKLQKYKKASPNEIKNIINLYNSGYTLKDISSKLHRSIRSIDKIICKHRDQYICNIRKNYWLKQEVDLLTNLYNNGYTYEEIAKKMQRSQTSITQKIFRLHKYGLLITRNERWTEDKKNILIYLYNNGSTIKSIARKMNTSFFSIQDQIMRCQQQGLLLHKRKYIIRNNIKGGCK